MVDVATTPQDIQLDGPTEPLIITWEDGHQSTYDLHHLRLWCPCADCTDHGARSLEERLSQTFTETQIRIRAVSEVGSYALNILWGDEHAHGIYSWQHLRGICPCESCKIPKLREG